MSKFAIYRVIDSGREYYSNPIRRGGEVLLFKNKKEGERWLEAEQPTTVNKEQLRFEVRKYVKRN